MNDNVNSPQHYRHGEFETIDEMKILFSPEEVLTYCKINAYKYKARAPFKGNQKEDLEKADWYLKEADRIAEWLAERKKTE